MCLTHLKIDATFNHRMEIDMANSTKETATFIRQVLRSLGLHEYEVQMLSDADLIMFAIELMKERS
jgi:hypothetical protein